MIVLIVIISIIVFIFILLHFSINIDVLVSKENIKLKVKWLFINIYPLKEKKISKRKLRRIQKHTKNHDTINDDISQSSEKSSGETNTDIKQNEDISLFQKNKNSDKKPLKKKKEKKLKHLLGKYEKIKPYIPIGKKAFRKLIKAIKINKLRIRIDTADQDAYECAMKYGIINAAVYNALGLIMTMFTVSIKKIEINPKFNSNDNFYSGFCRIKVRPSTLISIAMFILVKYLYTKGKIRKTTKNKEMEML